MAEMTAQQIARKRLAQMDIAMFAPPPKKTKPEPIEAKYTKPKVILSAEERKEKVKEYNHNWYVTHKEHKKEIERKRREANPESYRSNSLKWYYENHEKCCEKHREWYRKNKEHKYEYMKEWRKKHPGYYTKEAKLARSKKNG